jgi:hypothetical protein
VEDPAGWADHGMVLVDDPAESYELEQRFHTLAIGSPPVRWIALELRTGIKNHCRPPQSREIEVRFDDGNFTRHARKVLECADRIDAVIKDTEEQHHIELPHAIRGQVRDIDVELLDLETESGPR